MSSIRKKIRLAILKKQSETGKSIRFSEVKSYVEKLRYNKDFSKEYSFLLNNYEELMEKLDEVNKELEKLRENGEKKFTKITSKNLEAIEKMDEFNLSSFREFYNNTAQVILSIMKIPARIQRRILKYENGKETIDALNSFLRSFRNLKKISSKILAENSGFKHHENALKKYKEMEESFRKKEDLKHKIILLTKEKEEKKRKLEKSTADLRAAQLKINNEEILEVKKRIAFLDSNIREMNSDLKINLRKGRRPISKILYSKNKKLFEFFQYFTEYPLQNINGRFWVMITTLEKESFNLSKKERKKIDDFLNFAKRKLNDMIREYEDAKAKKKKLEEKFSKFSSRNKELLGDVKLKKEIAQNDFTLKSKKLDDLIREKEMVEISINKNASILENMLSKIYNNKVRIEFD